MKFIGFYDKCKMIFKNLNHKIKSNNDIFNNTI